MERSGRCAMRGPGRSVLSELRFPRELGRRMLQLTHRMIVSIRAWRFAAMGLAAAALMVSSGCADTSEAVRPAQAPTAQAAATSPSSGGEPRAAPAADPPVTIEVVDPNDAQLKRLEEAKHSLKWNFVPDGKSARYGHAEVLIEAPLEAVRREVVSFGKYKYFVPGKFKAARMVAKSKATTDMYFRVPIMHGMVMLWYVTRFERPRVLKPGVQVVEGSYVRGNINGMHIVLTMRAIAERRTILSCDLLLLPKVDAPQEAIDEELRDAAMQAVDAIHDFAIGKRTVPPMALRARG